MNPDQIPEINPLHFHHLVQMMAPARAWHRPRFYKLNRVDRERPTMFVLNHNILGMEVPFVVTELFRRRKIIVRGLAVKGGFHNPFYRTLVGYAGFVEGNRTICSTLMEQGAFLMVAPGGERESLKKRGEAYELKWKNRLGFVRMAVKHGYSLTPLATVGLEDSVDIVMDPEEIMASPIGAFLERSGLYDRFLRGGRFLFPLVRGVGWSPLPRPERAFFSVGTPVETAHLKGDIRDRAALEHIQDRVRLLLEDEIAYAKGKQAKVN